MKMYSIVFYPAVLVEYDVVHDSEYSQTCL